MENYYSISKESELTRVAQDLLKRSTPGTIVALSGPLGAGKTTFTQYLARELGIADQITSPTFTYANEYPVAKNTLFRKLIHVDMYRLTPHQAEAKGVLDMIGEQDAITVVEWADKLKGWLNEKTIWVEIRMNETKREIFVK